MANVLTTAARALKERQKNRNLPTVDIPQVKEDELARTLHSIQEHLRMYEGDSGAPKERFITLAELENSGLIKSSVKGRFAYVSQVLGTDVAQMAGSTSNPTQTASANNDTSRTARVPSGGSDGGSGSTASGAKLNDNSDVDFSNPANNDFLYFNGNEFTTFPLFKQNNVWFGTQQYEEPIIMREQAAGPTTTEGLGYIWIKDDAPNTLWFTDDGGTETQLATGGVDPDSDTEEITGNWEFSGIPIFTGVQVNFDADIVLGSNNFVSGKINTVSATQTNLRSITNAINTNFSKFAGSMIWDSTNAEPVWAVGSANGSVWVNGVGTTVHTPV